MEEKLEHHRKLLHVNVPKIVVNPRYRMKGKSGSAQMAKRKAHRKETLKDRFLKNMKKARVEAGIEVEQKVQDKHKEKLHKNILDRFK